MSLAPQRLKTFIQHEATAGLLLVAALIGLEIKRKLLKGSLSSREQIVLPTLSHRHADVTAGGQRAILALELLPPHIHLTVEHAVT